MTLRDLLDDLDVTQQMDTYVKETWPSDATYPHGTQTKDGKVIRAVYRTVNGLWYAFEGDSDEVVFQDEIVPADSPRVLNTTKVSGYDFEKAP